MRPSPTEAVSVPRQLSMALDAVKLRGLSPTERGRAVALLARLLREAAGAGTAEERDDDSADPLPAGGAASARRSSTSGSRRQPKSR